MIVGNDLLSVLGTFVGGVLSSLLATIILPSLAPMTGYGFVRCLSFLSGFSNSDILRHRNWTIVWEVASTRFPPSNSSQMKLYVFLGLVAGEWKAQTTQGGVRLYRMIGTISNGNKLTARWFDAELKTFGYRGALQVVFLHDECRAEGIWIGFATDQSVKSGAIKMAPAA